MSTIIPVASCNDASADTDRVRKPKTPVQSTTVVVVAPGLPATADHTHALGETIASLAASLHAATYRLLVLLREFDARAGWNNGFLSCGHWLHWRTGFDLGASREKVRVARALPALPRISWAMEHGQLSYAKVRALTRVATSENEAALLDVALAGTAAQVERFVRAWRRVDRVAGAHDEGRFLKRELATWVDDDGMVVIRGRLTPEVGAVVQRALEAAADRQFREACQSPTGGTLTEEVTPAQRRADALGLMAEAALSADLARGHAGDRYQVVVHVVADMAPASGPECTPGPGPGMNGSVLELEHGAQYVSEETSRRLSCDAAVVTLTHGPEGEVLNVGRRTRTIPTAIRRALDARDRSCHFPGCTSRRCDAHHVEHWADGGATRLDNLVLLCRRHHRAVHEGGFDVAPDTAGGFTFYRPDGKPLSTSGPHAEPSAPGPEGAVDSPPVWDGTRFDIGWAIDVVWQAARTDGHEGRQ